jgi:hypothetical protein
VALASLAQLHAPLDVTVVLWRGSNSLPPLNLNLPHLVDQAARETVPCLPRATSRSTQVCLSNMKILKCSSLPTTYTPRQASRQRGMPVLVWADSAKFSEQTHSCMNDGATHFQVDWSSQIACFNESDSIFRVSTRIQFGSAKHARSGKGHEYHNSLALERYSHAVWLQVEAPSAGVHFPPFMQPFKLPGLCIERALLQAY